MANVTCKDAPTIRIVGGTVTMGSVPMTPASIALDSHLMLAADLAAAHKATERQRVLHALIVGVLSSNTGLPANVAGYQYILHLVEAGKLNATSTLESVLPYVRKEYGKKPDKVAIMNCHVNGIIDALQVYESSERMVRQHGESDMAYWRYLKAIKVPSGGSKHNGTIRCIGDKTASFGCMIMHPLTWNISVVDRWIIAALGGDTEATKNEEEYLRYDTTMRRCRDIVAPWCPLGIFHWATWDTLRYVAHHKDALSQHGDSHTGLAL